MKLALVLGLLALAQEPSPSPSSSPAPASLRVSVSPQVGHAPISVRLTAIVTDEARTLSCPGFAVEWGDGCKSAAIPLTCDPYQLVAERPTVYAAPPMGHRYHQGDTYTVRVDVFSGGEKVLSDSARLEVVGPLPLTEARAR